MNHSHKQWKRIGSECLQFIHRLGTWMLFFFWNSGEIQPGSCGCPILNRTRVEFLKNLQPLNPIGDNTGHCSLVGYSMQWRVPWYAPHRLWYPHNKTYGWRPLPHLRRHATFPQCCTLLTNSLNFVELGLALLARWWAERHTVPCGTLRRASPGNK